MNYAPIALFAYNRPWHTRQTIEALKQNSEARESNLFIYSDAAKTPSQMESVRQVREYVRQVHGFRSVTVIERESNYGLARSIMRGVNATLNECGRIIVLEDDMVTSPYFLQYMNDALERFANDDRVACIHGYAFPIKQELPEAYFLPGADCWGWATWSRGWACFNPDGQYLLDELRKRDLTQALDYNGAYPFSRMLEGQIKGKNDSWAVRWYASAFLAGKLTLHPGRSLVHNIGNDNSGTHSGVSPELDVALSGVPIDLSGVNVEPCDWCRSEYEKFFRSIQAGRPRRLMRKIRTWLIGR